MRAARKRRHLRQELRGEEKRVIGKFDGAGFSVIPAADDEAVPRKRLTATAVRLEVAAIILDDLSGVPDAMREGAGL